MIKYECSLAPSVIYVVGLDGVAAGSLMVKMAMPKNALYYLWARVKGDGALTAGLRTKSWGHIRCRSEEWIWQKAEAAVELTADEYELLVQPTTGSECLDKVLLTDDSAFVPAGMLSLDSITPEAPTNLTAHALWPNAITLTWSPVQAADIAHFNVYCSRNADFACEQASLVGSPSETEFVNWSRPKLFLKTSGIIVKSPRPLSCLRQKTRGQGQLELFPELYAAFVLGTGPNSPSFANGIRTLSFLWYMER